MNFTKHTKCEVASRICRSACMNIWRCFVRYRELVIVAACFLLALKVLRSWEQLSDEERRQSSGISTRPERFLGMVKLKDENAVARKRAPCTSIIPRTLPGDVDVLLREVEDDKLWAWIARRIKSTWRDWYRAAQTLTLYINREDRIRKRILIVPGVLLGTPFAANFSIKAGGPLGDLYQWSDVIAALYVLGHNLTLTKDFYYASRGLRYDKFLWSPSEHCEKTGYDLVFSDIITMKALSPDVVRSKRCVFRVLDAYGTEQMYNNVKYSSLHDFYSYYGQLQLNLKQFYTFYPHTPDNSFMGFAVSSLKKSRLEKENIGVLYGKETSYFQGTADFIKQLMTYMNVHCTLNSTQDLPQGVINHGILSTSQYRQLLTRAKYFIGVGQPMESTGVMEALAHGCVFINPKYSGQAQFKLQQDGKPTTRRMTSQVPYLEEEVGPPHVLTIDIHNREQVRGALVSVNHTKPRPFIPHEYTMEGFLERLTNYIENQDFCNSSRVWPPLELARVYPGRLDQSCVDVCRERKMLCENVYFPAFNATHLFADRGISCSSITVGASIYYPAFIDSQTTRCFLQADADYFSCAGSHETLKRVCPCRKYRRGQIALWEDTG